MTRTLVLAGLALAVSDTALADCVVQVPPEDVEQAARAVEAAYVAVDEGAFLHAARTLERRLPCTGSPLDPPAVVVVHRAMGLIAFTERRSEAMTASFRAARRIDDALPTLLDDPSLPHWRGWQEAEPSAGPRSLLPTDMHGWLLVDGEEQETHPSDAAWLVQHLDDDGRVLSTAYQQPGDALALSPAPPPPPPQVDTPEPPPRQPATARRLTGVGMALAGIVAMGVGSSQYASASSQAGSPHPYEFVQPDPAVDQRASQGTWVAGAGGAGLAMGLTLALWPGRRAPTTQTASTAGRAR